MIKLIFNNFRKINLIIYHFFIHHTDANSKSLVYKTVCEYTKRVPVWFSKFPDTK